MRDVDGREGRSFIDYAPLEVIDEMASHTDPALLFVAVDVPLDCAWVAKETATFIGGAFYDGVPDP